MRGIFRSVLRFGGIGLVTLAAACATVARPAAPTPPRAGAAPAVAGLETGKMWIFENPPVEYLQRTYRFTPPAEWLDAVRQASLRFGRGCSASFISAEGLILTNHHCARSCIAAVSTPERDYVMEGFYAAQREDERPCPGLFVDQLVAIEDVTERVAAAVRTRRSEEEVERERERIIEGIERECREATRLVCTVISLYHGGRYSLYRYRRYEDVRLVFAPEGQIAFFGGDPDNFTYPRHDLDVTFLRAYVDGKPAAVEHFFRWSEEGAAEEELVFVVGNPGSTGRLNTVAQLERLRDDVYPAALESLRERVAILKALAARGPEAERRYRNEIFGLENSIKAISGYQSGLLDTTLMARKVAWEAEFRGAVMRDRELRRAFGDAWERIAQVQEERARLSAKERAYLFGGSPLLSLARTVIEYVAEKERPSEERLPAYRDAGLERVARQLAAATEADTALEERVLAAFVRRTRTTLPPADPLVQALGAGAAEEVARTLVGGARVGDVAARTALVDGGAEAVARSDDPLIRLARAIDPAVRELRRRIAELQAIESVHEERLAKALFQVYGDALPPDATFTLRFSDGVVRGYPLNGTLAPYKTTFYGLYDRSASFDGRAPWNLPPRWVERRDALDLATPLNFVCTADIIGGNSGSPVINRDREIVGLIFDGNIEMLPNRFLYTDDRARAVSVHSEAIVEALRKVYDASVLADELEGRRPPTARTN